MASALDSTEMHTIMLSDRQHSLSKVSQVDDGSPATPLKVFVPHTKNNIHKSGKF